MHFSSLRKIIFVALCTLVTLTSLGQENQIKGYIIQLSGDTLNGFIDYRNWDKNPSVLSFKVNQNDVYQKYTPTDIAGYGVDNEIYKSAAVETEISSDNESSLTNDSEVNITKVTVFLQELLRGEKGLYYFVNQVGKNQFYIYHDGLYELLVYKRYNTNKSVESKTVMQYNILKNRRYIGQLMNYMQDCNDPKLTSYINNSSYTSTDLKAIFKKYLACKGTDIKFTKKGKKLNIELGVMTGLSMTSLDFAETGISGAPSSGNNNLYYYTDFNPEPYIGFTPGIIVNIVWPYGGKKWSLYNEATYSTYKSSQIIPKPGYGKYYDINHDMSTIRLNNLLRYTYPFKNFSIFLNAGVANTLKSYYRGRSYLRDANTHEVIDYAGGLGDVTSDLAMLYGIGGSYNRFSLEYRLEAYSKKTVVPYLNKSLYVNHLLLSYKISLGGSK